MSKPRPEVAIALLGVALTPPAEDAWDGVKLAVTASFAAMDWNELVAGIVIALVAGGFGVVGTLAGSWATRKAAADAERRRDEQALRLAARQLWDGLAEVHAAVATAIDEGRSPRVAPAERLVETWHEHSPALGPLAWEQWSLVALAVKPRTVDGHPEWLDELERARRALLPYVDL